MSYIIQDKEQQLRTAFTEILQLRFDALQAFSYKKLLEFEYDEICNFIRSSRNTPGKPWPALKKFMSLTDDERKQIALDLVTEPDNVTLPAIRFDILLKLTTYTPEQVEEANQALLRCVRDAASTLDLKRLVNNAIIKLTDKSKLSKAEITMSTAYEAVHSTCLRLSQMTTSMKYLNQWLLAHAGHTDHRNLLDDPTYFSYDQSVSEDNRALSEIIGKEHPGMRSLEEAQTSLLLVTASLQASEAFVEKEHGQLLYSALKTTTAKMLEDYKQQNYVAVQQAYEVSLEQIESFSKVSSKTEKLEFKQIMSDASVAVSNQLAVSM